MLQGVARARELDQFASDHDAQLLFVLRARQPPGAPATCCKTPPAWFVVGAMPGARCCPPARQACRRAHRWATTPRPPWPTTPEQSAIRDISLSLDVAQVHRTEQPFARLREVGAALAQAMDGVLCDQNGQPCPPWPWTRLPPTWSCCTTSSMQRDLSARCWPGACSARTCKP